MEKRNAYRTLVGMPKRKRPPARHRRRWEDNIKINFRGIGWGVMDWKILLRIGTSGELS
jgi:hypothetical protein